MSLLPSVHSTPPPPPVHRSLKKTGEREFITSNQWLPFCLPPLSQGSFPCTCLQTSHHHHTPHHHNSDPKSLPTWWSSSSHIHFYFLILLTDDSDVLLNFTISRWRGATTTSIVIYPQVSARKSYLYLSNIMPIEPLLPTWPFSRNNDGFSMINVFKSVLKMLKKHHQPKGMLCSGVYYYCVCVKMTDGDSQEWWDWCQSQVYLINGNPHWFIPKSFMPLASWLLIGRESFAKASKTIM